MANLVNNTLSFTPKTLPDWYYKVLLKPNFIAKDYCRVEPNVTKEAVLRKLVMANNTVSQVDNRDCAWTPKQRFTNDTETFTVKNWKINEEQCLEELDSIYSENVLSEFRNYQAGATKTIMPNDLENAIMFHLENSLGADIDRIIIGGTGNAVDGIQNGLIDKALASSNVIKVANTVNIDATNVLSEIQRVYDSIPNVVINESLYEPEKAPVRIFVDINTYRYALQALSGVAGQYQVVLPSWTYEGGVIRYMGVEIALVSYMPANTMFAASRDNIIFFTDLLSDTKEIRVAHGNDLKDESMVYIKGNYRAEAAFVFEDEVVLYSL